MSSSTHTRYEMLILTIILIHIRTIHSVVCTPDVSPCECTASDEPCSLSCTGVDNNCKPFGGNSYTLRCQPNQKCSVRCEGNTTCQDVILNDNGATNVDIWCGEGTDPCTGSSIFNCGSGDCSIRCKGNAPNSCIGATVYTNNAKSFECEGFGCPQSLVDLYYTAAPTTTAPTLTPTAATASPSSAPITLASSTFAFTFAPSREKEDDFMTIIIIVSISVVGLAAICFGIFCIYKRRKDKTESDDNDIEGNTKSNTVTNTLATRTPNNTTTRMQRPQSVPANNYNRNQYNTQVVRHQSVPQPHVHYNANMTQQYSNANTMQAPPQYYNNTNSPQNTQGQSQMTVSSDGTDASLYEKQQQYAQEEMNKNKSTRSVLSANTDVSLYETQQKYARQELAELHESKEVDTFDDAQAEQVGNVSPAPTAVTATTATTDVSLYETQQKYLQEEMEEMNAKIRANTNMDRGDDGGSISTRKSSRV